MFVDRHKPPYRVAGVALLTVAAVVGALIFLQFRGDLSRAEQLTLVSSRAGLVVDPGSKVTYNGVEIGRVADIGMIDVDGVAKAELTLDVDPRYLRFIPANVDAQIRATTVFGNKYVSFSSPANATTERISARDVIDVSAVTTEFNTLFETVTQIAAQVDPIKVNQTLSATAEALTGLGDRFGRSLLQGNKILSDLNPQMPQIRRDTQLVVGLVDVYADASPDLWDGLDNGVPTAQTFNDHRAELDAVLLAAVGLASHAETFDRVGPYLARGAADLVSTTRLLDEYRGMIFCTIRKFNQVQPRVAKTLGGNGYSLTGGGGVLGGGANPYIYPDNLPRVNARGGPEGRPGCWQDLSRELYPAPYLVIDTGASIAPYNHFGLGQPLFIEYVWGRQVGELTINP